MPWFAKPHRETVTAFLNFVLAAFSGPDHDGREEVDIVRSTWERGATALDLELVAVDDEAIVGHVPVAWGDLSGREVAAVAPLAVSPSHQGFGIGSALMTELYVLRKRLHFHSSSCSVTLASTHASGSRRPGSGSLTAPWARAIHTFSCVVSEVTTRLTEATSPTAGNEVAVRTSPKNPYAPWRSTHAVYVWVKECS